MVQLRRIGEVLQTRGGSDRLTYVVVYWSLIGISCEGTGLMISGTLIQGVRESLFTQQFQHRLLVLQELAELVFRDVVQLIHEGCRVGQVGVLCCLNQDVF